MNKGELKYPQNGDASTITGFGQSDFRWDKLPQVTFSGNFLLFKSLIYQTVCNNLGKNIYWCLLVEIRNNSSHSLRHSHAVTT